MRLNLSLALASLLIAVHGHAVITEVAGANGKTAAAFGVIADTPRDGSRARPFQQDSSIIRDREIARGTASPCGRTRAGGVNDIETNLAAAVTVGLPTADADGLVSMTLHQVNGDGAGPYTCEVSADATGSDFVSMTVVTQVPGTRSRSQARAQDFPLVAQMPAGLACTGGPNGDACIVRCRNSARAGPFGGCVPVTTGDSGNATVTTTTASTSTDAAETTASTTTSDSAETTAETTTVASSDSAAETTTVASSDSAAETTVATTAVSTSDSATETAASTEVASSSEAADTTTVASSSDSAAETSVASTTVAASSDASVAATETVSSSEAAATDASTAVASTTASDEATTSATATAGSSTATAAINDAAELTDDEIAAAEAEEAEEGEDEEEVDTVAAPKTNVAKGALKGTVEDLIREKLAQSGGSKKRMFKSRIAAREHVGRWIAV